MSKHTETFPVAKNGEFFGYADAGQIARSNGALTLFDENKAAAYRAQIQVDAIVAREVETAKTVEAVKKAGGADASAVKKAPPAN